MDKAPQVKLNSTAHYFLEGLNDIGIEYLFSNFGTDHAPLIEEMARWKKEGRGFPKVLNCPHENTAMHMAAGFAMATGRGQAVMVHLGARAARAQTWDEGAMRPFPEGRYGAVSAGAADAAAVAQVAGRLLSAKHPVMVTSYAGRNPEAPALIEELARFAGIRVYEASPLYL